MIPTFTHGFIVKEKYLITENDSCFDTTAHSTSNRRLIVRVCRDRKYCDNNACTRKCCAEDEIFSPPRCEKHYTTEELTEFHQVFANALNATQLSTFDTTKGGFCEILACFFFRRRNLSSHLVL